MAEIRLQKYFTDCGVMSRRTAETEIAKGLVKVNGVTAEIGCKIDPDLDVVEYKGKIVKMQNCGKYRSTYILLNKPVGYVCTLSDEDGRLTVRDLIGSIKNRVYPVGRLDMYSDGLLIMTDDGELTNKLTHPSGGLKKTYIAEIPQRLTDEDVEKLSNPIEIDGYMIRRPELKLIESSDTKSKVQFVLSEGRNRQIRRMCAAAGYKLVGLHRVKIGEIEDKNLPLGKWRFLTEAEIKYLKEI